MRYLLISFLFLAACTKPDDNQIQSATGAWYVNGVAHTPDTIRRWGVSELQAEENSSYSLSMFYPSIPVTSQVDTISMSGGPGKVRISVKDAGKYFNSQDGNQFVSASYQNGNMVFSIPETEVKSNTGQTLKVSGTIIYDLP